MKEWVDYVDMLKPAAELLARLPSPGSPETKARLWRQLAMNMSQGYFLHFQSTPEHPEFSPFENSVFLAQPNPDAVYYYAPVAGSGAYRVTGDRGNAPVVGFALGSRIIGMDPTPGKGLGNFDIDDLKTDANGRFEVIFSTTRPAGHDGNWLPLHPDTDFILVRQFSYHWGEERDVRVAIERLDAPDIRPAETPAMTADRLEHLFGHYVRNLSGICHGAVNAIRSAGFVNRMRLNSFQDMGNGKDWPQAYFECAFDLGPDEALIIETELPEKRPYWNVQVIDRLWNQVEFLYRQSSLNGAQAKIDSDGKFRAVLSHRDPGFANWLDTGGNTTGMLIGRWYRCSSQPTPDVKVVRFDQVAALLDPHAPRCSATERADAMRQRRVGGQLRRRW